MKVHILDTKKNWLLADEEMLPNASYICNHPYNQFQLAISKLVASTKNNGKQTVGEGSWCQQITGV